MKKAKMKENNEISVRGWRNLTSECLISCCSPDALEVTKATFDTMYYKCKTCNTKYSVARHDFKDDKGREYFAVDITIKSK